MWVVVGTTLLVVGCGGSGSSSGDETVVAAFYPLAYAASQLDDPGVDVVDLTRAGEEPHDIELSPRDVARIDDAKLVVYLGHGFQPAVEDAIHGRSGPSSTCSTTCVCTAQRTTSTRMSGSIRGATPR